MLRYGRESGLSCVCEPHTRLFACPVTQRSALRTVQTASHEVNELHIITSTDYLGMGSFQDAGLLHQRGAVRI